MTGTSRSGFHKFVVLLMAGILIFTGIAKLGEGVRSDLIPLWLYQLLACIEVLAGVVAIVGYWRWPAMFSLLLACGGAVLAPSYPESPPTRS